MAAPSVTGEEVHSDQQSDEGNGTPVDAHSTSVFPVNVSNMSLHSIIKV